MPEYSLEKFEGDMKQLGGMIENFYSQDGGDEKEIKKEKEHLK